ncbi:MAG: 1-acyl-sn-glycerol-3-phosphate acyltransferase [Halobacteriovoraceae bacterium]|nr:1-acyl-sn-glycerol-3-phosphate acyltransferase [Halobacteriovoraceae bacterium]MCB9095705.1 1-acyl-sn-glycerol-3-phosphate acyltransferase [Halobacteriovoraceae bacterium]
MNVLTLIVQIFLTVWAFLVSLIAFFTLLIPTIPFVLLPKARRLKVVGPFWRLFAKIIIRVGLGAHIYLEDHRSEKMKKYPHGLYICNHQSLIDVLLNMSVYTIPPIMKKQVLYIPLFGLLGYASGAIPVDRSSRKSRKKILRQAVDHLKKGIALFVYPEGTRNREKDGPKELAKIKPALLKVAYENNYPTVIASAYRAKNSLTSQGLVNWGNTMGLKVQHEITPRDFATSQEFVEYCWQQVHRGYHELEEIIKN